MKGLLWALAVSGFFAFGYSFPKLKDHPSGRWHIDRATAHSRATAAARELFGVDATSWEWRPRFDLRQYLLLWQRKYGKTPGDYIGSVIETELEFNGDGREISVRVCADGRVCGASQKRKRRERRESVSPAENEALARRTFALIAGKDAARFQPTAGSMAGDYRWEAPADSNPQVKWEIRVRTESWGLRDATLRANLPEAVRQEFRSAVRGTGETVNIIGGIATAVGGAFFSIVFLFGVFRRRLDWKSAVTGGVLFLATGLLPHALGTLNPSRGADWQIEVNLNMVFAGFAVVAAIAVGESWARELEWSRWNAFRLLMQRKWRARSIGTSLANGLLWSGVLACIYPLIIASGAYPNTIWNERMFLPTLLYNVPSLQALHPWFDPLSFGLFVGLLPLLSKRIGLRIVVWGMMPPLAILQAYLFAPLGSGLEGLLQGAVITAAALIFIYWQYGLLAVIAAGKGSLLLTKAAVMLTGPESLHSHGWIVLAIMAAAFVASLVLAHTGQELQPADPIPTGYQSEREKLKAEFGLAQQAQQRLLPSAPPVIPGFSIAASCQPAREVGGDLYDYFQLADGRYGFCVADVSGKGMPAALYMTLTKGLLAAASPEAEELHSLASHVNRHLYVACKRKMFVTAVLASLDPATRRLDYLRAGHNPALHYRAARHTAEYRKPPGIGLGLTPGGLFDRGTKTEMIELEQGDSVVLYSDGVTEAMNEQLELYGEDRLQEVVEKCAGGNAAKLLEAIRADVASFTGTEPAHDDITLLVLRAE